MFIPTNQINNMTTAVVTESSMHLREIDVFSMLMKDRIIFLGTEINNIVANTIIAQLLYLQSQDANADVTMYINSPGGSVYDGLAIIDTMNAIKPKVKTVCVGMAASMGAMILMSGEKGSRMALPSSRVMIHQPLGGAYGQASDIAISNEQIQIIKTELSQMVLDRSKLTQEEVDQYMDRDHWMKADAAVKTGIIDGIVM